MLPSLIGGLVGQQPRVITFATWNPSDKHADIALSGGNLTATKSTGGTTWRACRATVGKTSGKWYWELRIDSGRSAMRIGVANDSAVMSGEPTTTANGWGEEPIDGDTRHSNSTTSGGIAANVADTVMVAVDIDAHKIWWGVEGVWFSSGNPAAGTGARYSDLSGTIYPFVEMNDPGTDPIVTANFGATAFEFTPPAGFNPGMYSES